MIRNVIKKVFASLVLIFAGFSCFAKENKLYSDAPAEVIAQIKKADSLIASKQYSSALAALQTDSNEYILYKRCEIYTQYFVQSIMHQLFAVTNLKKNEDIVDIRKNPDGEYALIMYDIEEAVQSFKDEYGEKPVLDLILGNFYWDVSSRYGNQWLKSIDELLELAETHLSKAYEAGYYDKYSVFALGSLAISNKDYQGAETMFLETIKVDPENSSAWFNLGVARMYLGKYKEAVEPVRTSIKYEKDLSWMADEYMLLVDAYIYQDDADSALKVAQEAKKKIKDNYEMPFTCGQIYLIYKNDYAKAEKEYLESVKLEETSITDIVGYIAKTQDWNNLISFCKKSIVLYPEDPLYTGFVEYIYAQALMLNEEKAEAVKAADRAEALFQQAGRLDDYIETLEEIKQLCSE